MQSLPLHPESPIPTSVVAPEYKFNPIISLAINVQQNRVLRDNMLAAANECFSTPADSLLFMKLKNKLAVGFLPLKDSELIDRLELDTNTQYTPPEQTRGGGGGGRGEEELEGKDSNGNDPFEEYCSLSTADNKENFVPNHNQDELEKAIYDGPGERLVVTAENKDTAVSLGEEVLGKWMRATCPLTVHCSRNHTDKFCQCTTRPNSPRLSSK